MVIIDGSSYMYRAYYALPFLSTQDGFPTQAIYGLVSMLLKVFKDLKPDYLVVCLDHPAPTFRKQAYDLYKATRPKMPEDLSAQVPKILEIIEGLGISLIDQEGVEADDLIASLAERFKKDPNLLITVVTSDKDLMQILDKNVRLLDTMKNRLMTLSTFESKYGILPKAFKDFLAICGDSADNVPGVAGIGQKGALDLIRQFGSVENLLKHLNSLNSKKRLLLERGMESLNLSLKLVDLKKDLLHEILLSDLVPREPRRITLFKIFESLQFKRFADQFGLNPYIKKKGMPCIVKKPERWNNLFDDASELYLDLDLDVQKNIQLECQIRRAAIGNESRVALWDHQTSLGKFIECFPHAYVGTGLKKLLLALLSMQIKKPKIIFDASVASYLIDPLRKSHELESLVNQYLGVALFDPANNPKQIMIGINKSSEILARRIQLGYEVVNILKEELKNKPKLRALFSEVELPLIEVLANMEFAGMKVDQALLNNVTRKLAKEIEALKENAYSLIGERFNLNSPKQLQDILFGKLGLPKTKKIKTGYSTDVEVLTSLLEKHEVIGVLLDYRTVSKLKNTYLDPLPGMIDPKTSRVHSTFNQTATATGRISSSDPNLQNIPVNGKREEEIRNIFIPDEGYRFVSFDYSQIELRLVGHLSQDEKLIQAFLNKEDIHSKTASVIFNIPSDQIDRSMRRKAKVINFGIIYGMTPYGLSKELNLDPKEAKEFIVAYFTNFPNVKKYFDKIISKAEKEGYVETILGRIRPIPQIKSKAFQLREQAKREAINTPVQGSAADLIKKAMITTSKAITSMSLNATLILQIHDELLFEVEERSVKAFIPLIKDIMENIMPLNVPLVVDIKVGDSLGQLRDFRV